jgi:hypothetical protein
VSRGTRSRATRKPVVVVAGEDSSDRKSLTVLLEAMCPEMRGRVVEINTSVRLRLATGSNLAQRVGVLARTARARAAREGAELACVFVHEDLDGTDGDGCQSIHKRVAQAIEAALGASHYVLVAAETEAWLLLFPEPLAAFASGWRVPQKYLGRDTGMIEDPKTVMKRRVATAARAYAESDAPAVLRKVVELGHLGRPTGRNRTWSRFADEVVVCCAEHLGAG